MDILARDVPLLGDLELLDITNGLVLGDVNLTSDGTVGVVIVGLYGLVGVVSPDVEDWGELPVGGVWGEGDLGGVALLTLLEASSNV